MKARITGFRGAMRHVAEVGGREWPATLRRRVPWIIGDPGEPLDIQRLGACNALKDRIFQELSAAGITPRTPTGVFRWGDGKVIAWLLENGPKILAIVLQIMAMVGGDAQFKKWARGRTK